MPESSSDAVENEPDQGRDRLFRSLFRPTRRQITVGLLLALLGFAGVTQVRATEVDDDYAGLREQDLIDVLDGLAGARQRAETERTQLEQTRADLSSTTSRREAAIEQATTEAETLSILAGLVPVTGSGIRITITEVTGSIELSTLLDIIQELRTVGAEAIQINAAVRVVAQTSFEDATGGFLVDGRADVTAVRHRRHRRAQRARRRDDLHPGPEASGRGERRHHGGRSVDLAGHRGGTPPGSA